MCVEMQQQQALASEDIEAVRARMRGRRHSLDRKQEAVGRGQTITVKIVSTDNKGLTVKPEGCGMDLPIKKSNIAINTADTRPSRFTGGERIDCAIAELDLDRCQEIRENIFNFAEHRQPNEYSLLAKG